MPSFWDENVSKSHGKHNLPAETWERICRIRNRPIRLTNVYILEEHGIRTILSEGLRGYAIDYAEEFKFTPEELHQIANCEAYTPVIIRGYKGILFLRETDFEVIEPFFDMGLADLAAEAANASA